VEPAILCAMIYDYAATRGESLLQVRKIAQAEDSPSLLFGFDETAFRQAVENLHENGWLRYESTHNLDQIRLKEDFSALTFLKLYYEGPVKKLN
jgi:DNA-binding transcriptional regulator PaaX